MDSILGNDESKQFVSIDTKNTLMLIQSYVVMETFEKNGFEMVNMMILMLRVGRKIIEVRFHDVFDVMESVGHITLESSQHSLSQKVTSYRKRSPMGK